MRVADSHTHIDLSEFDSDRPALMRRAAEAGVTHMLLVAQADDSAGLDRGLTIGRDLACKLAIDDRKASRQHARVERRNDGCYLVDTSTNGTFVTLAGRQEVMVRRNEMALDGKGKIAFGASANDPQSDLADFEHL